MFAYCGNNPVNYIDPTGNISIWYYLFQDFRFGLLHSFVQAHILATYRDIGTLEAEYYTQVGRADIVNTETGDVWEIKHGRNSGYFGVRTIEALAQVSKYLGQGAIKQLGPAGAFNGSFVVNCSAVSYQVDYFTPEAGVILYTVTELDNLVTSPKHVYVPVRQHTSAQERSQVAATGMALGIFFVLGMYDRTPTTQ